ncbi:unnamed protein product [Adineta steineri]|uniref:Antistasin-like domain-containing protein n=1 Tax=Adineta steineri TaxID=433720 RepID=A0A819CFD5_9BILA|nr:unnamed protein product [Adineta steineri]CAF3806821.1 unnamed protein product [Adineta steineri]
MYSIGILSAVFFAIFTTTNAATCSPVMCMMACQFGFEVDANGCPRCACRTSPSTCHEPIFGHNCGSMDHRDCPSSHECQLSMSGIMGQCCLKPTGTSTARPSTTTARHSTSTARHSTSTAHHSTSTARHSTSTAHHSTSTARPSTSTRQTSTHRLVSRSLRSANDSTTQAPGTSTSAQGSSTSAQGSTASGSTTPSSVTRPRVTRPSANTERWLNLVHPQVMGSTA